MSRQKEILREIAQVIAGNGTYRMDAWFTEDFRLVKPTKPEWPRGHEGARKLLEAFRTLTPPIEFVALDMVEEGTGRPSAGSYPRPTKGQPFHLASMAIYRFQHGRIAEDWGIPIRGEWLG